MQVVQAQQPSVFPKPSIAIGSVPSWSTADEVEASAVAQEWVQALPLAHLELQGGGRQGVKLDVQNCPALAVLGVEVEASLPPTPW